MSSNYIRGPGGLFLLICTHETSNTFLFVHPQVPGPSLEIILVATFRLLPDAKKRL